MSILRIKSISQLHEIFGLEPPKNPLISIFNWQDIKLDNVDNYEHIEKVVLDFYIISHKDSACNNLVYGRNTYDFDEGSIMFMAPGQAMNTVADGNSSGWVLIFHPEFLRHTRLSLKMSDYSFFNYEVHEALYVSEDEKSIMKSLIDQIIKEYTNNTDGFTKDVIIAQLELLLNYSKRLYSRQFYTRTTKNNDVISQFEKHLQLWFDSDDVARNGLPSVSIISESIGMSPDYLSDMLKQETGKNAQDHIHYALIDRAKNLLLGTSNTLSEIAYTLGFEYPQYFSKLFKQKTGMTPTEYRKN